MIRAIQNYGNELVDVVGSEWNRFWFTPLQANHLWWLRRVVLVITLLWLLSFSGQLSLVFGNQGWLTLEVVHQTTTDGDLSRTATGFSHLFVGNSPIFLWATHAVAIAVVVAAVAGFHAWLTTPLSLLVVLSYIHRSPMLTTPFETVLCMLLLYLSIGPFNNRHSNTKSWTANLSTRLIQIHLCGLYLLIATSKLGTIVWWTGDASWYLMTDYQHRLIDLSAMTQSTYAMNAITHAWLLFELLFPVLIWVKTLRPLVIFIACTVWAFAALITGQVGYCVLMTIANLAFVDPAYLARNRN